MKRLTCEMCGSTDLMKQDGVFVCQSCGTKYSIEEAKKMMVEGTVDVSGSTIKVDSTDELSNLYQLARRARRENNAQNAAKYYDMILVKEPTSWEASFYSVYYHALSCKIIQIESSVNAITNSLESVFSLIGTQMKDEKSRKSAYLEVAVSVIAASDVFFAGAKSAFKSSQKMLSDDINASFYKNALVEFSNRTQACGNLLLKLGNILKLQLAIFPDDEYIKKYMLVSWKKVNTFSFEEWSVFDYGRKFNTFDNIKRVCEVIDPLIREYEPEYQNPFASIPKPAAPSSGCYVATAVYGSYDCPQVWTLRRFRDYTLAETWYGRAFIRTYDAISPTLVKWFGHTEWFKKMWKGKLDRMVAKLKAEGFEDTPYEDRKW